ncbi:MAG: sulfotransferase domain-containing protein [Candidatus Sericytochromatia bacterium]
MTRLSVLVYGTLAQAAHLPLCLEMLSRQRFKDFEVLLAGEAAAGDSGNQAKLAIRQLSPAGSFAQAFNQAAGLATGDGLVSLNASTLLNPEALGSYAMYLAGPGQQLVFGYMPTGKDRTAAEKHNPHAPSLWFPDQPVAYLDYRITLYRREALLSSEYLPAYPYWFATGTNFAISRALALELGCDESLTSSRRACVDLAYRAQQQGQRIDFLVDAWAEQLIQPADPQPYRPSRRYRPHRAQQPARMLFTAKGRQILMDHLFGHYLQQDPRYDEATRNQLAQPGAELDLGSDHYAMIGLYQLKQRPADARPGFLILGAQKAGTTSLYHYLDGHPQLIAAYKKEISYFNRETNFALGPEWYLDHFLFAEGKLAFEGTPEYLNNERVPARIAAFAPGIRLIVILREPVARAFSAWNMYHKLPKHHFLYDARSFEQAISDALATEKDLHGYLDRGRYLEQIRRYLEYFPREQLLLLDFDELTTHPDASLARCSAFLGLSTPLQLPEGAKKVYNPGKYREPLPEALKARLQTYFSPYNHQLREAFGLDYAWLV